MARIPAESRRLTTTPEVLEALGGIPDVCELTGGDYKQVENWKRSPTFPANYFLVMALALAERGCSAPASLWRQDIPRNKEALLWALARKLQAA